VTRECLRLLQARLSGAAFSLGTFFVAVDKESASPVGANTHYQQPFRIGKSKKLDSGYKHAGMTVSQDDRNPTTA